MSASDPCPCGGKAYDTCCRPFHDGARRPQTAEQLMRSRYAAFVKSLPGYLEQTLLPFKRKTLDSDELIALLHGTEWLGLRVLETTRGGPKDVAGTVTFEVTFRSRGRLAAAGIETYREKSQFRKRGDRWYYVKPL